MEKNATFSVNDISPNYQGNMIASSHLETISTGTVILNSKVTNSSNVEYSLLDEDSKFQINSSTGQVTLANELDYETSSSHVFSVQACSNGECNPPEEFTLSVDDHTYVLEDSSSLDKVKKVSIDNNEIYLLDEDMESSNEDERTIANLVLMCLV